MFGKAMDGTESRDVMGAVTFYFIQLVMIVGLSTVLAHFFGMAGVVDKVGGFFEGGQFHTVLGTAFVLWLGGSILSKRGSTSDLMSVLVVTAAVFLAWTSSIVFGMIPIALLTTMGKK